MQIINYTVSSPPFHMYHHNNLLSIPTSLHYFQITTLHGYTSVWSTRRLFHLRPLNLLCITNILKTLKHCRPTTTHLLNACQLYTTIGSLAHVHMLPLTHKQLHHYSLTSCICPGKGAVQEEIQKIMMECEMTNTK